MSGVFGLAEKSAWVGKESDIVACSAAGLILGRPF